MAGKGSNRKQEVAPKVEAQKPAPKAVAKPKDVFSVVAVIRPMYSPDDRVLIPEGGAKGVLIKKSSWAQAQLDRGLLRIME